MLRNLLLVKKITFLIKIIIICLLQQQVPLPLPCFNFAQITTPSITPLETNTSILTYIVLMTFI